MERLSISNFVWPVSFAAFSTSLTLFKELVEESFGCDCTVKINAMSSVKWTTTFMLDDGAMDYMAARNRENTFCVAESAADLGRDNFDKARYIEVIIAPRNESDGPNYAFAHMECKGTRRRQLTFYVQPDGATVMKTLARKHRHKLIGDGYTHNSD